MYMTLASGCKVRRKMQDAATKCVWPLHEISVCRTNTLGYKLYLAEDCRNDGC